MEDGFKEFKVTVPDNRRYYDDETSGVLIKRGAIVPIGQRQFRSVELKHALLKSQVLIAEGECRFVYKDNLLRITKGENQKNLIEVIEGPEKAKEVVQKIEVKEVVPEVKIEMPLQKEAINVKTKISEDKEHGKKIGQHSTEPAM